MGEFECKHCWTCSNCITTNDIGWKECSFCGLKQSDIEASAYSTG